jgi:polyhydroxyalkanoate synthase
MLGEAPPAFDLLYWNGDGTNLPATMAVQYLRGLCQQDGFAKGEFQVFGKPVSLADVKLPLCAIACETDHIAPWKASFNGIKQMGSQDKTFLLSESGHIAGIINPPSKDKYGHYTNDAPVSGDPEAWLKGATFHKGSWWPRWGEWLKGHSGPLVKARVPVDSLCAAPGTYVVATPDLAPSP